MYFFNTIIFNNIYISLPPKRQIVNKNTVLNIKLPLKINSHVTLFCISELILIVRGTNKRKNTCCRHWNSNLTLLLSKYWTFSALLRTCSSLPETEGALYSCVISICCFYSIQNTLQAPLPASKEKHSSYLQFRFGSNDFTGCRGPESDSKWQRNNITHFTFTSRRKDLRTVNQTSRGWHAMQKWEYILYVENNVLHYK